ncbi:MAG: DUF4397 domain-containing protein [Ktedonobacteraceae bacterium]
MKITHSLSLLVQHVSLMLSIISLFALFGFQSAFATTQSPSFVRIIHASPDVGTADVFVDGSQLLSSFAFGSITGYASIPAGPHKVQIALVGKGIGGSVITQTLAVSPGVAYTVAAIGTNQTGLKLVVFIDNNQLSPGSAEVRVYHLSPDFGPIDVTTSGSTLFTGVNYQQATDYRAIGTGAYTFDVHATNLNTTLPIAATLNANTVTSIFTVGLFNGNPKITLVPAQVSGLPGLPGTGSDPNAQPTLVHSSQPFLPWLFAALAVVFVTTSVVARSRRRMQ